MRLDRPARFDKDPRRWCATPVFVLELHRQLNDKLEQIANSIGGNTICALGDAASMPVQSFLKKFKPEFLRHVEEHRCPFGDTGWGITQTSRDALVGAVRY